MAGEGNSEVSLDVRSEDFEEEMPESLRIPPSDIQVEKQSGRGGFSTVHKAFWRGQACAAKVVQTTDVRAIQKEVAILSKLDHPHVIRCIGFSVDSTGDPSRWMILMELMDEDLRHVLNRRLARKRWLCRSRLVPFNEAEAMNILEQIAAGMKYLHTHKVFHGDLKASNILVSHGPDGGMHVKITDFGVSQMVKWDPAENLDNFIRMKYFRGSVGTRGYQAPEVSSSSINIISSSVDSTRSVAGTRGYMAPEYFRRTKFWSRKPAPEAGDFYTAKADTYCFAMTCYEILSGRVPFEDVRKPDIASTSSKCVASHSGRGGTVSNLVASHWRPVASHSWDVSLEAGRVSKCGSQSQSFVANFMSEVTHSDVTHFVSHRVSQSNYSFQRRESS